MNVPHTASWPAITRNCSSYPVQTTPTFTIRWRSFRLKSLTHSLRSIWDKAAYYVFLSIWRKVYIRFLLFLHRMYWNEIQTLYAVRSRMMCLPRCRRIHFWQIGDGGIRSNIAAAGVESWWLTWWISWWVSSSKLSWVGIMGCVIGLIIGCAHDRVLFHFCGKKNAPGVCTECIFLLSK